MQVVVRFYSCRLTICLDWITWPPHTLQETSCKKEDTFRSSVEVQDLSWFYEYLLILCLIDVLWIIFYQNSHWGILYEIVIMLMQVQLNWGFLQEVEEFQTVSEYEWGRVEPIVLKNWSLLLEVWPTYRSWESILARPYLCILAGGRELRVGSPWAGEGQLVAQHTLNQVPMKEKSKNCQLICWDARQVNSVVLMQVLAFRSVLQAWWGPVCFRGLNLVKRRWDCPTMYFARMTLQEMHLLMDNQWFRSRSQVELRAGNLQIPPRWCPAALK